MDNSNISAFGYINIQTHNNEEERHSLIELLQAYCQQKGYQLIGYTDNINMMLHDCQKPHIFIIIDSENGPLSKSKFIKLYYHLKSHNIIMHLLMPNLKFNTNIGSIILARLEDRFL